MTAASSGVLEEIGTRFQPEIGGALRRAVPEASNQFWRMVHYHLGWCDADGGSVDSSGGKQIRPLLVLLAAEAAGGDYRRALSLAAGVELVHNFSLVHDDVQDRSEERRHRPTVWKLWGEAQAINVGDGLHVLANQSIAGASSSGLSEESVLAAMQIFNDASLRLCEGQYLDMDFQDREDVSTDDYLEMIRGKTAALIGASLALGAIAGGAPDRTSRLALQAGVDLGIAFQVQDDVLGMWGTFERTGKPTDGDIIARKKTYPVVYALEQPSRKATLLELYRSGRTDARTIAEIRSAIDSSGSREAAADLARRHLDAGLEAIDQAFGEAGDHLARLARFLAERDF